MPGQNLVICQQNDDLQLPCHVIFENEHDFVGREVMFVGDEVMFI
jgi:hypothetical protein